MQDSSTADTATCGRPGAERRLRDALAARVRIAGLGAVPQAIGLARTAPVAGLV